MIRASLGNLNSSYQVIQKLVKINLKEHSKIK